MSHWPSKFRAVLIAVLVPFLWLSAVRLLSLDRGCETSADDYYHVAMADLFPEGCVGKTFPWMTMSIWKDQFYDKELFYHAMLAAFRGCERVLGWPLDPPLHFPGLAFDLLLIVVFAMAAAAFRIPRPYFLTAILVMLCPFFTQRLLMLRPHVLAITIMLAYCWHLTGARRLWLSFAFGVLTAYAYSNPHFILLPAAVFGALMIRRNARMAWLVPLATLGGLLAGLTLHPQFPNTFILWKIQCVDVIRQAVFQQSPVYLGVELYQPKAAWLVQNAAFFGLLLLNGAGLRQLLRRCRPSFETAFFLILQTAAAIGIFLSKRVLEYGWPFALLAGGLLFRDLKEAGVLTILMERCRKRAVGAIHLALAVGFCILGILQIRSTRLYQVPELRGFGDWAAKKLPQGTAVANPNWSDFPQLFYSAPQFRYSLGIDPMFGYHAMPEKIETLEAFRTGRMMLSPRELRDLTQSRFAFVSSHAWMLAKDMHENGYVFIYQGDDGWLFDLDPQ